MEARGQADIEHSRLHIIALRRLTGLIGKYIRLFYIILIMR